MDRVYAERIVWENEPSAKTPINETNLNKMDYALNVIDERVVNLDITKAGQSDLLQSLKNVTYNETTGIFTFNYWNGQSLNVDLNIEKIPVSFTMSEEGVITMITADGTTYTADIKSLITNYDFDDTPRIVINITDAEDGTKIVKADVVKGSITGEYLQPNYLADITLQADAAKTASAQAVASAEKAKEEADRAEAIVGIGIATTERPGIVKPDGTTVTVDEDGTIHSVGGAGASSWEDLTDKPFERIGTGLSVDEEGNLNAEGEAIPENVVYFEGNALKDKDGNEILPNTSASNVNLNDGTTVENKIGALTEGLNGLNTDLTNTLYADDSKSLKQMIDEFVCPNTPYMKTKYFTIQSSDGWFNVECNNHNNDRFTGICLNFGLGENETPYNFSSFGGASTVLRPFKSGGGEVKELLWTNPNPSVRFDAQTVSLNLTEYDQCMIEFNASTIVSEGIISRVLINKNEVNGAGGIQDNSGCGRKITMNDNGIIFSSAYKYTTISGTVIPIHIYGIRKGIPSASDYMNHIFVKNSEETVTIKKDGYVYFVSDYGFGNLLNVYKNNVLATPTQFNWGSMGYYEYGMGVYRLDVLKDDIIKLKSTNGTVMCSMIYQE